MYYSPVETLPRDKLRELQNGRFLSTLTRLWDHVPAYRDKLGSAGISLSDIRGIDDIEKLPFTTKQEFRDNYPFGLFAVPMNEVIRIHASSGTTGKQTVVGYTRNDMAVWGEVMARTIAAGGIGPGDIGQISYGYGLFTGGLGGNIGSETLGCATIPASTGNTKRQIMLLSDFGATFILCTPSYALTLAEYIETNHIPLSDFKLKSGFFGAEPWTDSMRREIERRLGLEAFDIYGLSEVIGPGVAYECKEHSGLHVNEDHFYLEIIDPDTGRAVPDGEDGEIVFSCITKEALPLLRYRTRDVGRKIPGLCPCGRTSVRMSKPAGRTDDMLIIRGVNVFPSQIESVLMDLGELAPYYQLIVERDGPLDKLTVLVELNEQNFTDEVRKLQALSNRISDAIASTLGIAAAVKLIEPRSIERFEGKAVRVIDRRKAL